MVQSGFCPSCGYFGPLVEEHRDNGSLSYPRTRGPPAPLLCRECIAKKKLDNAKLKQGRYRLNGRVI